MANKFKVNTLLLGSQDVTATGGILYINSAPLSTSSNLGTTGSNLYSFVSNLSGNLATTGNSSQIQINTTISNLGTTGQNLYSFISSVSGNLISTGINLSSYISSISGNLASTGNSLQNQVNTLTTNLGITGSNLYNFSSNISGNLISSGANLASRILIQENLSKVSSVSITGSSSLTGLISLTGIGGLQFYQLGNTIQVSGGINQTVNATNNYFVNSGSGTFLFRNLLASGISTKFVPYPVLLNNNPIVLATLHNDISNTILSCQISGGNTSGFWAILSNTTNNSGYFLDCLATNATGTGLATTVIVNNLVTGWYSKSITMESPNPGDNVTMFYTANPIQVTKLSYVIRGISPSGIFSIKSDPDRTAAGTEVVVGGTSVTGVTLGQHYTSFDNSIISGNNFVWFVCSTTGGTVSGIHQTLFYTNI